MSATSCSEQRRLLDPVRAYLEAPRCAVLAVVGADGAPRQAIVHYMLGTEYLLVNGRSDRLWVKNLRREGCVSIVDHDAAMLLHWVGVRGTPKVLADGAQAVEDAMRLARRYGEDPAAYEGLQRVSFRIIPQHVFENGPTT